MKEELASSKTIVITLEDQLKNGKLNTAMEIEENEDNSDGGSNVLSKDSKKSAANNLFSEAESREILALNSRCIEAEEEIKK